MHQLSRLLLSGLVALTLTVAAVPAQASWSVSISDVMNLVYCLVGAGDCDGLAPASTVDITSDNAEVIAAAMPTCDFQGGEVWDGSACASPETPDTTPNCYLMGMCGQDGAAQLGITGQYSESTSNDAFDVGAECLDDYSLGLGSSTVFAPYWLCSTSVFYACE